jgi:hypothetical protein
MEEKRDAYKILAEIPEYGVRMEGAVVNGRIIIKWF